MRGVSAASAVAAAPPGARPALGDPRSLCGDPIPRAEASSRRARRLFADLLSIAGAASTAVQKSPFRVVLLLVSLVFSNVSQGAVARDYVAFSLGAAQDVLARGSRDTVPLAVYNLGGITGIRALVHDRIHADVILVGEHNATKPAMTLDDFAVALRARFIYTEWPSVDIRAGAGPDSTEMQVVTFGGGIQNTQLGRDLLDADYCLKLIELGLLPSGVPGLEAPIDLSPGLANGTPRSYREYRMGRFWFYPVLSSMMVRDDVVGVEGLRVGVFYELLAASIDGAPVTDLALHRDAACESFARMASANLEGLAVAHPPIARLEGLEQMVGVCYGLELLADVPALSYWLSDYRVTAVFTDTVVVGHRIVRERSVQENDTTFRHRVKLSGGVELSAIALRVAAGDVSALKAAVLQTRPTPGSLVWRFAVVDGGITFSSEVFEIERAKDLFVHASFLVRAGRYSDAIVELDLVLRLVPDWGEAYLARGVARSQRREYELAIADLEKAAELEPHNPTCWLLAANVRMAKEIPSSPEEFALLRSYVDRGMTLNPNAAEGYLVRGSLYNGAGLYHVAIADFSRCLDLARSEGEVACYARLGQAIAYAALCEWEMATDLLREVRAHCRFIYGKSFGPELQGRLKEIEEKIRKVGR